MTEKLRKIHCIERMKEGFDDLPTRIVKDMCGFVFPEYQCWVVTTMWEGESMVCTTQELAEIIANQQMMLSMMLQRII